MQSEFDNMVILATNESMKYASRVHKRLQQRLGPAGIKIPPLGHISGMYFPNREVYPQIGASVRNKNVYLFHAFCGYDGEPDPNVGLVKLALIDDAIRNSSPNRINYIAPWFPYLRQDRIDRPRVPISARRALKMIEVPDSKIHTRLVTYDMHAGQVRGFVSYQIDDLYADPLFYYYMLQKFAGLDATPEEISVMAEENLEPYNKTLRDRVVVVSPDAGGATRARRLAKRYGGDLAMVDKRRSGPGESDAVHVLGGDRVSGRIAMITDDMIDTAGTIETTSYALRELSAEGIYVNATHAILSADRKGVRAEDKIRKAGIKAVVADTIPRSSDYKIENGDILEW